MANEIARSTHAQLTAMRAAWPQFVAKKRGDGLVVWQGPLRPRGMIYRLSVFWWPGKIDRPYVIIADPEIRPRENLTYADIPHLMFNPEDPSLSGLCLFDPAGREWTPAALIADTTVLWASEWLHYYELWHLTGEWLAPGVGPESVASLTSGEALAIEEAAAHVH
jgi:hypothetical protein